MLILLEEPLRGVRKRVEREKERRKIKNITIVSVTSMFICLSLMLLLREFVLHKNTGSARQALHVAKVYISGGLSPNIEDDSIESISSLSENTSVLISKLNKGNLKQQFFEVLIKDISYPTFCALNLKSVKGWSSSFNMIVEPGDSIMINIKNYKSVSFSGQNAFKYQCFFSIDTSLLYHERDMAPARDDPRQHIEQYMMAHDSIAFEGLRSLEAIKKQVSQNLFRTIQLHVLCSSYLNKIGWLDWNVSDSTLYQHCRRLINENADYKLIKIEKPDQRLIGYAPIESFFGYALARYKIEHSPFDLKKCYEYFRDNFTDAGREFLVYKLLVSQEKSYGSNDLGLCIKDALGYFQNRTYRSKLSEILSSGIKGTLVYNFSLENIDGKIVRLSDFKGSVVLIDSWELGCGNCAQAYPYIDSLSKIYEGKKFALISIAAVQSRDAWIKNIKSGKFTSLDHINLRCDPDASILKKLRINGFPTFILIDKNGRLMSYPKDPRSDKGASIVKLVDEGLSM